MTQIAYQLCSNGSRLILVNGRHRNHRNFCVRDVDGLALHLVKPVCACLDMAHRPDLQDTPSA